MKSIYSDAVHRPAANEPGKYYCPKCERYVKLRPQKVDGKVRWLCKCGTVIK